MSQPQLIDCHTHTAFSYDSDAGLGEMYGRAEKLGISVYAVTDHCDHCCDTPEEQLIQYDFEFERSEYWEDTEAAFRAVMALKEQETDSPVRILNGIELGEPLQDLKKAERILTRPYDMVIGSLHNISGFPDFYFLDFSTMSRLELREVMVNYFLELTELAKWNRFDTLAHITYPFRYLKERNVSYDMTYYDDMIEQVLKILADSGKALELNTSGLRQKIQSTLPEERYVRRFRELGGELVTIGSDAHDPAALGTGILEGYDILRRAGFRYVTYYEHRRPVQTAL